MSMENNENSEFSYVQEKIRPKARKRLRRTLAVIGISIVAAVIFGFVARLVFVASGGAVNRILGITPTPTPIPVPTQAPLRNEIKLPTKVPTCTPTPTATAVPTPTEAEEIIGTPTAVPEPTQESTPTPVAQPSPTEMPDNPGEGDANNAEEQQSALGMYMEMMSELKNVAVQASKSLVRVYAVKSGINWMDESVETKTELSGVIVADNGVELLICADYQNLIGTDRIEVEFAGNTVLPGTIYSHDEENGIAVIAVPLNEIPDKEKSEYTFAVFDDSEQMTEGEPVIAIGRPNGYFGAVEYGFVTRNGITEYFTDGVRTSFTTGLGTVGSADGIVVNLEGKMTGVILSSLPEGRAVEINSVRMLLEKLLNGDAIPFFGIRAENVPQDILEGMGLSNGIYVNEVIASSPAFEAGIKKGDVLVAVDGNELTGVKDFYEYLLACEPESESVINLFRSGRREEPEETLTVIIGQK